MNLASLCQGHVLIDRKTVKGCLVTTRCLGPQTEGPPSSAKNPDHEAAPVRGRSHHQPSQGRQWRHRTRGVALSYRWIALLFLRLSNRTPPNLASHGFEHASAMSAGSIVTSSGCQLGAISRIAS